MPKITNASGEGDTGLNTGGMGAISPVTFLYTRATDGQGKRAGDTTNYCGVGAQDFINSYYGFIYFAD
jgi:phosphoribosylamine-glycine ligase